MDGGMGLGCLPVVAQETEPVPLRALGVPRLSSFYDADGDGVKEFYDLRTMSPVGRYHWQAPGCYGWEADVEVPDLSTQGNGDYGKLLHVNNDGIPDFSGFVFYDISPVGLAVSRADGSYRLMGRANAAYPLDVNHDGLTDLFSFNRTDWNILYQNPDGSYTATRIDTLSRAQADSVVARKMEEDNGAFDLGDMASWLRAGMFVGGGHVADEGYKFTRTLDVNRDGLMDLVGPRTIFYNLGDNRFVASPQPGELTVKDLNGDGIPDYIYNDTENQRVYTRVYLGNEKFREQTLVKDLQVTDIHCFDFDRDGDVDLLLTFDYLDSSSFSFLLFAENTGGGQFTLHEHSFAAHWAFGACLDFDNDGYMELLAGLQEPYYGNEESSASVKGLYLFRLNDMAKVEEPEEPLVNGCFSYKQEANSQTDWKTVVTDKLSETVIVADVDNDGYLDVLADTSSLYKDSYDPKATVGYWSARTLPLLKGALANEAPERMAVPTMILDRKNGRLKLAWKAGKDKETSTVDLTYALRIGSAPGKDDIYFSGANADGSRRDFLAGNMGANLETTLYVSRWKHGIYYISIQTVDPMGKGSVWSEELVYEHRLMQAAFAVSDDESAAADTLVLTAAPRADGLDYAWDFDGGKAIKASADSAQVWLTFDVPGEKHLRLTVRNPEDGTEDICEQLVTVQRVSFEYRDTGTFGLSRAIQFWDMDGDGALDVMDENGFYVYNGTDGYEKLGTIFNSNLQLEGYPEDYAPMLDFDMDGDADVVVRSNKGNLILNSGNRQFEAVESPSLFCGDANGSSSLLPDLNNDGFHELYYNRTTVGVCVNTGDNIHFERFLFPGSGEDYDFIFGYDRNLMYDINRDGYLDFYSDGSFQVVDNAWPWCEAFAINQGGMSFTYHVLPKEEDKREYLAAYEDMDSDGVPDKVLMPGYKEMPAVVVPICFGRKDYTFDEPMEYVFRNAHHSRDAVEVIEIADFDNNGCPDILVYYDFYEADKGEYAVLLYMERDRSGRIEVLHNQEYFQGRMSDVDHDGRPDFHSGDDMNLLRTGISNSSPEAPAHVRATQEGLGVLLEWDDAYDKETPAMQMRYNISVKKKGAEGEGAYILSPLNGGIDKSAVIPGAYYQKATRKMIPIERFEAGQEYEVQVQAIDLWDAHSPMSEVYTFKMSEQFIAGPTAAAPHKAVELVYHVADEAMQNATWNWDGGTLLKQEGNRFEVLWDEPGLKTVTVTAADGETATKHIMVRAVDLAFDFPTEGLAGTEIAFMLPEAFAEASREDIDIKLSDERIEMLVRVGSREAKAVFPEAGDYSFHLSLHDSVCGVVKSEEKHIRILGEVPVPVIRLVGIDGATGKNKVMWDMPDMPDYVTTVNVYKENGRYNAFDRIAEVVPADGEFIDQTSNPSVSSDRYCLKLGTTFGVESPASRVHSGTHLMLNKGVGGAVNLMWSAYEGGTVDSYRILRGTSADNLERLAEISGAHTAYTDLTAGDWTYFYALEYDQIYTDEWQPLTVRSVEVAQTGRSNVVCTDEAWAVTPAETLSLLVLENSKMLTPGQPALHLSAEILPVAADIKQVNWQIIEGGGLASLTQGGALTAVGNQDGRIVVRATTVDGTELQAELVIEKAGFELFPQSVTVTAVEGEPVLTPDKTALQLQAVVSPEGVSQAVEWSIVQGTGLATVSESGVLMPAGTENGDIVVRATSLENPEAYGELKVVKSGFTSVGTIPGTDGCLSVSREGDILWITGLPVETDCLFRVTDLSGRVVQTVIHRGNGRFHLSIGQLPDGVYVLQVVARDVQGTFRFIR